MAIFSKTDRKETYYLQSDIIIKIYMEQREKTIFRVTLIGSIVNAILIALKLTAGILGRSSALIADGVHSLTDFITDLIVLIFVKLSGKPKDKAHSYGHGKFETLATLIIGVFLTLAGLGLLVSGGRKIVSSLNGVLLPEPTWLAFAVATASIVVKEMLYRYTVKIGNIVKSDATIANAWHHRSDAISSLGTMTGIGGAILLGDRWRILDPLAAVLVSVFIVKSGFDIMRPAVNELLEGALPEKQSAEISELIESVKGVRGFHNLRTRKIGSAIAVDVHVKMDGKLLLKEAHDIATQIEEKIREKFGKESIVNIHMEPLKP